MKSICLGVWGRERRPRHLTNHVAANPQAYWELRKAWRVYAASAEEARRLIMLFEAGRDTGTAPFGRPRVEVIKGE
ncbi:MAG TPA: hypothetical protein PLE19_22465 [Planctomycetota bacterium]|nr:hypothetical protein [Planctomycetota bacterium]HRR83285.1 hypothetical protein [Planctomycetota bacterium]HRT97472.1 hypothetical protein [Planctomycetota bacterium]